MTWTAWAEYHHRRVFNLCYRMTLSLSEAETLTVATFRTAAREGLIETRRDSEGELALLAIATRLILPTISSGQEVSFEQLDETLRSEATRTDIHSGKASPERDYLLWDLKQGCMTAVANCLSPGERGAFLLCAVFGLSDERGAKVLGISDSAYKVRLSRARKKVTDYLSARCEHVNPENPCHCPSRLGVAMAKGFIAAPLVSEIRLLRREPFGRYGVGKEAEDAPQRDVMRIYGSLPEVEVTEQLWNKIEDALRECGKS